MMLWKNSVHKHQELLWISVLTTDGYRYSVIGNYNEVLSKRKEVRYDS